MARKTEMPGDVRRRFDPATEKFYLRRESESVAAYLERTKKGMSLIAEPNGLKDRLAAYKASQEVKRTERAKTAESAGRPAPADQSAAAPAKTGLDERRASTLRDFARELRLTEDDAKHISFDKEGRPTWSKVHASGRSEVRRLDEYGKPETIVYRDSSNSIPVYAKGIDEDGYETFAGFNEDGSKALEQTFRKNDDGSLEVLFNGREDMNPLEAIDAENPPDWLEHWEGADLFDEGAPWNVQQAAKAGDAGESKSSGVPSGHNPVLDGYSGPRIVINPSTFRNEKDALCVAFDEAFRILMEVNGFDPVAEPTEKQREFFADTAYAGDENMMRRTILARICTFDTSVSDPTDEQLQEAVEFLDTVLEIGAPQNQREQKAVERIRTAIASALESGEHTPAGQAPAPGESPEIAAGGAGSSAGGVPEDAEKSDAIA